MFDNFFLCWAAFLHNLGTANIYIPAELEAWILKTPWRSWPCQGEGISFWQRSSARVFCLGGGILHLASPKMALLPTERHRKPPYLNASICGAFQGRFFVTSPIWKLIPINRSCLYQKIAPANTDSWGSVLKITHKVFNLVFHTGWKSSLQRKGTCVLYQVREQRLWPWTLKMMERNMG